MRMCILAIFFMWAVASQDASGISCKADFLQFPSNAGKVGLRSNCNRGEANCARSVKDEAMCISEVRRVCKILQKSICACTKNEGCRLKLSQKRHKAQQISSK